MYIIINLLILVLTLFIYIHVYNHINSSNYLEIYEVDNVSKEKFEDLCNLKQPLILNNYNIFENINLDLIIKNYSDFDIKINKKDDTNLCLPIKLTNAIELFHVDSSSNYISYENEEFLEETTLSKEFNTQDLFLRPYNVSNIKYNIILGSINSYTKLQYSINCRNYFYILNGSVEVTLCCPNNYKYLYINKNYELLNFESVVDLYNIDEIYKKEFNKVKFLRVTLTKNKLLQIPAYWFYSIKILEENTLLSHITYRTYMNSLAISPYLFLQFLQNNNIKRYTTKILDNEVQ
tara:strand:+ start:1342 stop:2217 length:876 start_codon:yes stop_codon:yes gene_type:complete